MQLMHYSDKQLGTIKSVTQQGICYKPDGLWVSVKGDEDWLSWCESQGFRLSSLVVSHEIVVTKQNRILHLDSPEDLHDFLSTYGASYFGSSKAIDWSRVANHYQGIIIAPYQWECRLHRDHMWYYGWDCASGCIWDASAIELVRVLAPEPVSVR